MTIILLFVSSSAAVYLLESAKDTFDIILQVGAGTGLLYLLRWFWWRINAWCEVVAMISSFGISATLLILRRQAHLDISTHHALLLTIAITTVCWVATAFLAPATDHDVLVAFYKKVRPFGPGWRRIREAAGISEAEGAASHENIPLALLGWTSGCTAIWSSLFAVGTFLYGRMLQAGLLLVVFIGSGLVLLKVINTLWSPNSVVLEADRTPTGSGAAR
jgi:solute:Na+ symporter, SSS family